MKWKSKKPNYGDSIVRRVFLLIPKLNEKTKEWHWFENVNLEYTWIGHRWTRFGRFING